MGKKTKVGKNRKDDYYYMAKSSGLRARSAFKLIEINKLFHILEKATVLIDLCAAPGGWMQVAARTMKNASIIVGIDLDSIRPIPGTVSIVADITTDRCKQLIRQHILTAKADVILHDGAPNVGANWNIDEFAQAHLALKAFALATTFLVKGGTFVTKVFRSKDYNSLKWVLEQLFDKVEVVKPKSSRNESAEIFLVCLKYKAPAFIDPKFLDIQHVFEDVEEESTKALTYNRMIKDQKKAEGYEEGDSLFKVIKFTSLVKEKTPMNIVFTANKLIIDDETVMNHSLTTDTIRQYITDLKLLGKFDFRMVEKWLKKAIAIYKKAHNLEPVPEPVVVAEPKTEEQKIEEDIARIESEIKKADRKKLKSQRKEKMKQIKMIQMNMLHPGDVIEQVDDIDMFSASKNHHLVEKGVIELDVDVSKLDKILGLMDDKRRSQLKKTIKTKEMFTKSSEKYYENDVDMRDFEDPEDRDSDDNEGEGEEEDEDDEIEIDVASGDEEYDDFSVDEDEEEEENEEGVEAENEEDDEVEEEDDDVEVDEEDDEEEEVEEMELDERDESEADEEDSEQEEGSEEEVKEKKSITNLNFDPSATTPKAKRAKRTDAWFNSSDFSKLMNDADLDDEESSDGEIIEDIIDDKKGKPIIPSATKTAKKQEGTNNDVDDISESNPVHASILNTLKRKLTPKERAVAVELIKSKKSRREILEWGYNRYQFDEEQVPRWLLEDELKHMRPSMPFLTADSINKQKAVVSTNIGKRTIKKVEQAKARKKNRVMRKLQRLNKRAEKIDDDLSLVERSKKLKEINSKVSKLKNTKKPVVTEVMNKSGTRNRVGKFKKGAKVKVVDRRMKSDVRSKAANAAKGKKGGRR